VQIGRVRAVVSPVRRVGRALADAITGVTPMPDRVSITGPAEGEVRLVPSDGALLPHLTVLQNIIASRRHEPDAAQDIRTRAPSYGLDGILDRYPHEIQAGRRRMTGLARALWARPDAVVLEDDPDVPSWGALLAPAWRGYQVRPAHHEALTPELLMGVATVLIVPTRDRARALDPHPLVLDRGTTSAG
jgi:ABC-type thiamine transport system ATPase subunit